MAEKIRIYGIDSRIHCNKVGVPHEVVFANEENYTFNKKSKLFLPLLSELGDETDIRIAEYNERYENPVLITSELIPLMSNKKSTHVSFVKDGKICKDREESYGLVLKFEMDRIEYQSLAAHVCDTIEDAEKKNKESFLNHQRNVDAKVYTYLQEHQRKVSEFLDERRKYTEKVQVPSAWKMLCEFLDADEERKKKAQA